MKIMNRFLIFALCWPLLSCAAKERPNIVMIIVDDLGWRDVGCYGSELYETPAVDALAAEGLSFSNAYASSPLCTPTRASILTGQTVGRLRITTPEGHLTAVNLDPQERETEAAGYPMTNPETGNRLPLDAITISKLLKDERLCDLLHGQMAPRLRSLHSRELWLRSCRRWPRLSGAAASRILRALGSGSDKYARGRRQSQCRRRARRRGGALHRIEAGRTLLLGAVVFQCARSLSKVSRS